MSVEQTQRSQPAIQSALTELQGMIQSRWPEATFVVSEGDDPEGVYLDAVVDIDDPDEVMDLVVDRLLDLQVEQQLPVHVVPVRPLARALEMTRMEALKRPKRESRVELELEPTRRLRP
jgi:hypothetical protein